MLLYYACFSNPSTLSFNSNPQLYPINTQFSFVGVMKRLFASILGCNQLQLRDEITRAIEAGVTGLHLDVMDGVFVDRIFLPVEAVNQIVTVFPQVEIECHLMVSDPMKVIRKLDLKGITGLIVHSNADHHQVHEEIKMICSDSETHPALTLAISPDEDVKGLTVPEYISRILIMSVYPGLPGQSFLVSTTDRIAILKSEHPEILVEVDGGINPDTIGHAISADHFVVGSFLFSGDIRDNIHRIRSILSQNGDRK